MIVRKKGERKDSQVPFPQYLDRYFEDGKTVIIVRKYGGLGDILMQRPIMRQVKIASPDCMLHYAVPMQYIPLVADLDDIDCIVPLDCLRGNYMYDWRGDISSACVRHEVAFRGRVHLNRTDVWAQYIDIEMTQHEADLSFETKEIESAIRLLNKTGVRQEQFLAVSPVSVDPTRTLLTKHVEAGIEFARQNGLKPVILHPVFLQEYSHFPQINGTTLRELMAIMTLARACFTTDTGVLHVAGYLHIPTVALFNHTSEEIVTKWYPTVHTAQMHRSKPGGMSCCPCYDWGSCKYLKETENKPPLKCFSSMPEEMVVEAFKSALLQPVQKVNMRIRDTPIRWWRVVDTPISEKPLYSKKNDPDENKLGIRLKTSKPSVSIMVLASVIAVAAKTMRRNTRIVLKVECLKESTPGFNLINVHRYISYDYGKDESDMDVWENHTIDWVNSVISGRSEKSLLQETSARLGFDLRQSVPCFYFDDSTESKMQMFTKQHEYGFVLKCGNVEFDGDCIDGADFVLKNDWLSLAWLVYHAQKVITDNIELGIMAALSNTSVLCTHQDASRILRGLYSYDTTRGNHA